MKIKLLAILVFVMVASLSIAGCTFPSTSSPTPTPTPIPTATTPTPSADLSSYFQNLFESGNAIMERPFSKSTSERGNDVYKGVARNASLPGSKSVTMVIEVTKSESEAKQIRNKQVSEKQAQGYTSDSTVAAAYQANNPNEVALWVGTYGANTFVSYYESDIHGWLNVEQSWANS